ncbi:MAG: D-glycerate dehydrogenase [Octadecabacter sp.]|jgi:lactate dehydrogenase-like 2-hydroxyacid dehydrogenase|nr:D-glycerate dehydrogenase [Octadecabacter sp.]MDC1296955.1 D-glycerate dehydrogenase [Octadecabacter sp.]MDC1397509.1 D-glycerate dehydrogenase [Octadecabacter sp.]|tara:strand:+ start:7043 stop:7990 length:948 start_codon:yes stop_codon:yes gene_type:complete
MLKLLITRPIAQPVLDQAQSLFDVTIHSGGNMTVAQAAAALAEYDAILPTLGDAFTADAFAGDIRCKMIGNFGVGYNHIDVEAAARVGIAVSNTPDVLTDATADIALTLLLATARRAGEGERMVRSGAWGGFDVKGLLGTHVTGKTLGVIGMGRIGQAIAARCHCGFNMDVVFHNRSPKITDVPATQLGSLHEVMSAADFVVVATPGGAGTTKLIDAAAFAAMKPSGIFINISRGEVVDEVALIDVLESRQIAGAGLDVYEKEPHVPDRLKALESCVLLPHLGSATAETRQAMGQMALDNIIAFSEGREPPQKVN